MTLLKKFDGLWIDNSIEKSLINSDGIIFDCDGVLIDISKSYDLTINESTQYVLRNFAGINDGIEVNSEIIDGFKATGGFNDEVDVTYGAIISIVAAKKLQKDQRNFIFNVIDNANSSGIISVEQYIEKLIDINDIKEKLSYPGPHDQNPLYKIFDQMFYGPDLYFKLFKTPSQFSEPGFIENDIVIFNTLLSKKLKNKFSKISIVTGRGKESVKFSLKDLLNDFDVANSAFLEDEPREMAKPNPASLLRTIKGMDCKNVIYVGDSMEDLIMAKKSTEVGYNTLFCGIIGTSKEPSKKLELFEKNGAKLVLESINLLPKVLNLE